MPPFDDIDDLTSLDRAITKEMSLVPFFRSTLGSSSISFRSSSPISYTALHKKEILLLVTIRQKSLPRIYMIILG